MLYRIYFTEVLHEHVVDEILIYTYFKRPVARENQFQLSTIRVKALQEKPQSIQFLLYDIFDIVQNKKEDSIAALNSWLLLFQLAEIFKVDEFNYKVHHSFLRASFFKEMGFFLQ